jgi:hypothetical protein
MKQCLLDAAAFAERFALATRFGHFGTIWQQFAAKLSTS